MKVNELGWPLFRGKVVKEKSNNNIFASITKDKVYVAIKNDISGICISKSKIKPKDLRGYKAEVEIDDEIAERLLSFSAIVCRIKPSDITEEQREKFLAFITSTDKPSVERLSLLKSKLMESID